jgi:WD40 repeat protein
MRRWQVYLEEFQVWHLAQMESVSRQQDEGIAKVWDANTGEELLTLSAHRESVLSVAFSPDGTELATAGFDGTAKIWDAATGANLLTITGHHESTVFSAVFSPDGSRLATSARTTARVWDLATGAELFTLSGYTGFVTGVASAQTVRRS